MVDDRGSKPRGGFTYQPLEVLQWNRGTKKSEAKDSSWPGKDLRGSDQIRESVMPWSLSESDFHKNSLSASSQIDAQHAALRRPQRSTNAHRPAHNATAQQILANMRADTMNNSQTFEQSANTPEKASKISLSAMPAKIRRGAWVEIDLAAIEYNVRMAKRKVGGRRKIMAVVKADAYGHGAVECAKHALKSGAACCGVATVDEAIELRLANITEPIITLSQPPVDAIPYLIDYEITPSVYSPDFLIAYAEAADRQGLVVPYHLAVNTGMNRIGVHYSAVVEFLEQVNFHRAIKLEGVFTHFATADSVDSFDFQIQLTRFNEAINAIKEAGFNPGIVHAANSATICKYPDAYFDMVRLGVSLYGLYPSPECRNLIDLKPVMSVHARITDARELPLGEGVSYGLHYRSRGSVKVCTIPIGYADGFNRILSGKTDILYNGFRCRQVGNICMDQCMFEVDLRSYASRKKIDPQPGDEVVILGCSDGTEVSLDDMADIVGTIHYEIACGFGLRLPKVYTYGPK